MNTNNRVTVVSLQGVDGRGNVDVMVAEIEGGSLGISMTERDGINMRRVGAEATDIADILALHNALGQYLHRQGSSEEQLSEKQPNERKAIFTGYAIAAIMLTVVVLLQAFSDLPDKIRVPIGLVALIAGGFSILMWGNNPVIKATKKQHQS